MLFVHFAVTSGIQILEETGFDSTQLCDYTVSDVFIFLNIRTSARSLCLAEEHVPSPH